MSQENEHTPDIEASIDDVAIVETEQSPDVAAEIDDKSTQVLRVVELPFIKRIL